MSLTNTGKARSGGSNPETAWSDLIDLIDELQAEVAVIDEGGVGTTVTAPAGEVVFGNSAGDGVTSDPGLVYKSNGLFSENGIESLALPVTDLVLTVVGTPGSTHYTYSVSVGTRYGETAALVGSITNGPAVLDGTNFVRISWTPPVGQTPLAYDYRIYRTEGGTIQGQIGSLDIGDNSFDDIGISGADVDDTVTGLAHDESGLQSSIDWQKVSTTRTVNGHALSADVTVTKSDVSLGSVDNVQQMPLSYLDTDVTLAANSDAKVGSQKASKAYADTKVPLTRTVNGHALSSNVTVTKSDISLGSVDNLQQMPLSYLDTDTTLAANSDAKVASQKAGKAYSDTKVPLTRTVNGHALSADVTVTKSDISLGSVDNLQQLPLSYLDTDATLAANSDAKVASQKAGKSYIDARAASPSTNDFRLTLATGNPVYAPQPATPSSTDTSTEICTFAAVHGWESGTIVTPSATAGGLTLGTQYYINKQSTTTVSFHTTLSDALAGTNKVNLTASITAEIQPSGITNTTVYFSPYLGPCISIYNGTTWDVQTSAEISLALGTVTSGKNYDFFAYMVGSTLTLEMVAWTSDTVRATDLARQNGVWCKSGTLTHRYVGTIRTNSTTTTIDDAGGISSQVGGKRFVWNVSHRIPVPVRVRDFTASWTLNTGSAVWRQGNAAAGNKVEFVVGLTAEQVSAALIIYCSGSFLGLGVDLDSITAVPFITTTSQPTATSAITSLHADILAQPGIGYHYMSWMEFEGGSGVNAVFYSNLDANRKGGLLGTVYC